jgi:hypothetical protein
MSLFLPFITTFVVNNIAYIGYLKNTLLHSIGFRIDHAREMEGMWSSGYVMPYAIEEKAQETKESFYVELAKDAMAQDLESEQNTARTLRIFIASFGISACNLFMQFENLTFLQNISLLIGEYGYEWMCIFIFSFLAFAWHLVLSDNDDVWIYCPSIADEFWKTAVENRERKSRSQVEARAHRLGEKN